MKPNPYKDGLLQEWAVSAWVIVLRTVWIAIFVMAVLTALRLMAWADTGMRGDGSTIEKSVIPSCLQPTNK